MSWDSGIDFAEWKREDARKAVGQLTDGCKCLSESSQMLVSCAHCGKESSRKITVCQVASQLNFTRGPSLYFCWDCDADGWRRSDQLVNVHTQQSIAPVPGSHC